MNPFDVWVLHGSSPEGQTPQAVSEATDFATQQAFLLGLAEAKNATDWLSVVHAQHRVDENGDVQPLTDLHPDALPTERCIFWGAHLEPGTQPSLYTFATPAAALAFEAGARARVADPYVRCVPDATFFWTDPLEPSDRLTDEGAERLRWSRLAGRLQETFDVCVAPDGRWVEASWTPGSPVENEPLPFPKWLEAIDRSMEKRGTSRRLLGLEDAVVREWYAHREAVPELVADALTEAAAPLPRRGKMSV